MGNNKRSTKYTSKLPSTHVEKTGDESGAKVGKKLLRFQSIQKDCKPPSLSLFLSLSLSLSLCVWTRINQQASIPP
jgi:hypothetical protein